MALIEFTNVSKEFSRHGGAKLLSFHLKELLRRHKQERFRALSNVTFRLEQGRSLGVVGRNGAGKSTLLSLVAGLCRPTTGSVTVNGRVAALLELGSGFHPDLTGMENVFLNASILGMTRKEANQSFDAIVEFSEIGEFIREPLRIYSSGMIIRLAFSVAVHADPEILMVDEVLAVGDQNFQAKCLDRIRAFKRMGKSLLFVSHSPGLIQEFCDLALWLDHGVCVQMGEPAEILRAYAETGPGAQGPH